MSDDFKNITDLSNSATVVMNTDDIDEKLRQLNEETVTDTVSIEKNSLESELEPEAEVIIEPESGEKVLQPDDEARPWDGEEDHIEKARQKKKLRKLVVFAIIAAVLVGILVAIIIAKNAHNKAEYISCYEQAQQYYDDNQYDKALEALRQAMSIDKTDDCLILMSKCYEAKNDYVNALAILESSTSGSAQIKERIRELKKAQQVFENGNKVIIGGQEYQVDITALNLSDKGLSSKELSNISLLTELTSLKLKNNKIDSIDFLKTLDKLVSLDLSQNDIENISALSRLTSLKTLHLDGNAIKSFEPLCKLTKLTTLTISDIQISKSQLNDLKKALPNCIITSDAAEDDIVEIKLGGKTFNSNVKTLDLSGCGISDISALSACTELESLNLSGNNISDISAIVDLPKLKSLSLSNNTISDIRPLMSITTIEYLDLSRNTIKSIAALAELTALQELSISGNKISDFSQLSNMLLLDQLGLADCGITDDSLPYLYKLKNLRKLALDKNDINAKAFSELQNQLPNCSISHSEFKQITLGKKSFAADAVDVDASGLGLKDISAASGFVCVERMNLSNNSISDLSPLYDLDTLKELNISGNDMSADQKNALIAALPNCSIDFG